MLLLFKKVRVSTVYQKFFDAYAKNKNLLPVC